MYSLDEVTLQIPEIDLDKEVDVLLNTPDMLEALERCVMNWQTQITFVIEEQLNKRPQVGNNYFFQLFSLEPKTV